MATAQQSRTAEEVARDYFTALGARDGEAANDLRAPDMVGNVLPMGVFRGREEIAAFFREVFAAFPDFELVVEGIVADERTAVVRWRSSGTFSGGRFQGLEPTGRRVDSRGIDWVEVEDGRIVSILAYFDGMEFARGVGVLPPRDSGAERAMFAAFNGVTKLRALVGERLGR